MGWQRIEINTKVPEHIQRSEVILTQPVTTLEVDNQRNINESIISVQQVKLVAIKRRQRFWRPDSGVLPNK